MKKKYDMEPIAGLFGDSIEQLKKLIKEPEYICPHCGYDMDEEEAESAVDCGCPACRCPVDWEESEYPRWPKDLKS